MKGHDSEIAAEEAGYSLVEMLVVLALVGVLSATIMMTTYQFRHLLRLDAQVEARLALQRTARHVARLLEQTEDIAMLSTDGTTRYPLQGDKDEVRFFAVARRGAHVRGLREIWLRLDRADGTGRLLQDMAPRRVTVTASEVREEIELASDVTKLEFSYYGAQDGSSGARWQSSWSDPKTLPTAISVRFSARRNSADITVEDVASMGSQIDG